VGQTGIYDGSRGTIRFLSGNSVRAEAPTVEKCSSCGGTILFGGVKQGELRFCSTICQDNAHDVLALAFAVPDNAAEDLAREIHGGICPRCQNPGPVDMHSVYWVWSALVYTRWGNAQLLSCRGCALKSQVGNLVFSAALGWWGMPGGLLFTPVQIVRNIIAIAFPPDPSGPSRELVHAARMRLAAQPRLVNR
jgi:hypothetical protein